MNYLSRLLLVIMVVLSTAVATTAPAAGDEYGDSRSAGHWTARQASVQAGIEPFALRFVDTACPTASTCVSVGGDDGPVARTIVPGGETTVRILLPADAVSSSGDLSALSCASDTFCVGVGRYVAGPRADSATFFASWDGSTWRSVRAPAPVPTDRSYGVVQSLSCGAPGACTAVTSGTIYTLSGGRWSAAAPPLPAGADSFGLDGVSCASATYCAIAGVGFTGSDGAPYAIVRDHGATTPVRLPYPPGGTGGEDGPNLGAIDCAAPGHCVILAGDQYRLFSVVSLDGTRAVYHRVPSPAGATTVNLLPTVSCPTVSTCWMVGSYEITRSGSSERVPFALRLQDGAVAMSDLPEPAPRREVRSELNDLDCPSATSCVAVGSRRSDAGGLYRDAVAMSLHRGIWRASLVPVPSGAPAPRRYELLDVACGAPARCTATGGYQWDWTIPDGDGEAYFAQRREVLARLIPR